ncbi:hypothetical protein [Ferrovibrio sp.]|uniref:hypothetical protein n=1 Tax=Ferrovibrio sp. TaxID=1917215 RepID=UPI00311F61C3
MTPSLRFALVIALGMALLAPVLAWGQHKGPDLGDHDWIQAEPRYLMQGFDRHCCEMKHCHPLPAVDVQWTADGWLYKPTGQLFPEGLQGTYATRDPEGRFFGCGNDRLWCLFYRQPGV